MINNKSKQPEHENITLDITKKPIPLDKILEVFGKRVKEERQRINITQEKLAEYADISLDTVKRIERGKSVKLEIAYTISEILQVPMQSLLPQRDVSENELIEKIQNAQETLQQLLDIYKKS